MKRLAWFLLLSPLLAFGQGNNNFGPGNTSLALNGKAFTVSTLPTNTVAGTLATVTDGTGSTDCATGGGSTVNTCKSNGSGGWSAVASGSGTTVNNIGATSHKWLNSFNAPSFTATQPAFTDISGTATSAQGGTGVDNTATLTLGSSNQDWATLGTGVVKNTTTTGALTNAAFADIVELWASGSCSGFLKNDGTCGSGGSGGDTITSPNSTLGIGGSTTNTTLDVLGSAGKILAGATPALTATPTLGASGTLGSLSMGNATSGVLTIEPIAGALGTVTTLIPVNDTLVGRATTDTLTNKTLTSPTLTTPTLGVASATTVNKVTLTAPATGSTLTIVDGKTLTANNSIALSGTDSTVMTFPGTSATIARTDAGQTFTGTQVLTATIGSTSTATTQSQGDNSTKLSTTAYTDLAVANAVSGVNPAVAVIAASTASLTGTYSNGAAGIGATFTVTATGAFTLDGVSIGTIGQRVLLKNQSSAFQNGVYTATIVGTTGVSPVFTRALDYDTPSEMNSTGAVPVQSGTANTTTSWLLTSTVTTIGTDALTYVQFSLAPSSLVTASSPGIGLCHFAGSTQACTSSAVALASADVTGVLPVANGGTNNASLTFPSGTATVPQTVASGQTAMPTGALSGNTCSASATTATATGSATTDAVEVTYASDPTGVTGYGGGTSGGITVRAWPTSNTMNFKLCNESSGSITPGALNINWRVVR